MSPVLIIIFAILTLLIAFQIWGFYKSKKTVGKLVPYAEIEQEFVDQIKGKIGLLYFYSPRCGNCKTQTPIINEISKKLPNIISIDASKHLQTARTFNVLGTPSIIIFGEDKIRDYFIGVKSETFLEEKLKINP